MLRRTFLHPNQSVNHGDIGKGHKLKKNENTNTDNPKILHLPRTRVLYFCITFFLAIFSYMHVNENEPSKERETSTTSLKKTMDMGKNESSKEREITTTSSEKITVEEYYKKIPTPDYYGLLDDVVKITRPRIDVDRLMDHLLKEGAAIMKRENRSEPLIAIEVGPTLPKYCLQYSTAGLNVHCMEPSEPYFNNMHRMFSNLDPETRRRIHLHNVAAGNVSDAMISFQMSGTSDDHVGDFGWDLVDWKNNNVSSIKSDAESNKVRSIRLDDMIQNITTNSSIFLLRIDTNGFEPIIISGLEESLKKNTVHHIVFTFWPKRIDILSNVYTKKKRERCAVPVEMLTQLINAGYNLYALPVRTHPFKAPIKPFDITNDVFHNSYGDLMENCEFYYELDARAPLESYTMGYWSTILAVAPSGKISQPVTKSGLLIKASLERVY